MPYKVPYAVLPMGTVPDAQLARYFCIAHCLIEFYIHIKQYIIIGTDNKAEKRYNMILCMTVIIYVT